MTHPFRCFFPSIPGDLLGLRYVPPYTSTRGLNGTAAMQVLGGVNYASAAGGILDETGQHLVCVCVHDEKLQFL